MARTRYFIRNIKYGNYFHSYISKEHPHFIRDYTEAKPFVSKKLANNTLCKFKHQENYEIVAIKCGK